MDRREFLKAAGLSTCLFLPGISAWAKTGIVPTENKLVVIFLRGAADGLSLVVPYSDPRYYSVRPKIAIPKPGQANGSLALNSDFALHPSLAPLMPLWQNKSLSFVINSGSPDPTRSHFDAQDYMESGIPGNKVVSTGWMNRLLGQLPNNNSPVRAINVGTTTPRILEGPVAVATYAPSTRKRKAPMDNVAVARAFESIYGERQDELGKAFHEGMEAKATISAKLDSEMTAADQGALPANKFAGFGKQLGKLIHEEPKVQVAFVDLGGFDTHVNQGSSQGQLANHLNVLGSGLSELATALGPSYNKTTVIVMSEFGRTVKENGNGGTDHGHGNVMWLMGGRVKGGVIHGHFDGLADRALYEGRDMPVHTDFREVLGSVVGEHMQLSSAQLAQVFPNFAIPAGNPYLAT